MTPAEQASGKNHKDANHAGRRLHVADVLARRIPAQATDKVYISARVSKLASGYVVHIRRTDPVVWLNAQDREEFGHDGDLIVSEVQSMTYGGATPPPGFLSLVSAGVFLWYGNRLVLLRRDDKAPSFPGHLTEPAQPCHALPGETALRALNEQLKILEGTTLLALLRGGYLSTDEAGDIKARQTTYGGLIEYVGLSPSAVCNPAHPSISATVYIDGVLSETLRGPHFFDKDSNTLEIRFDLALPEDRKNLSFADGGPYGREVVAVEPAELAGMPLTPCLANYVATAIPGTQDHAQPPDVAIGESPKGTDDMALHAGTVRQSLDPSERQVCEVWTRVMGYHRPVASFNDGKKSEFAERRFFREDLIGAEPERDVVGDGALSGSLRIYMAGPLFTLAERSHNKLLAEAIEQRLPGAKCVLPSERAEQFLPDLRAVALDCAVQAMTCQVTVACLDGADVDSGTCTEIVHAGHHGNLVIGYRTDFRGSELDGVNAMVRYAVDEFIALPAYSATIDALADAVVGTITARLAARETGCL